MNIFLTLFPFWAVPILFLVACLVLLFRSGRNWKRPGLYGLAAFGLFLLLGAYSIFQSRSSTAGIGFIFLPVLALVPGGFAFLLGKFHKDYLRGRRNNIPVTMQRIALVLLSLLVVAPFVWQANALVNIVSKNSARDLQTVRNRQVLRQNYKNLAMVLSQNPGTESDILEKMAGESKERVHLLPIAASKFASSELLDRLGRSEFFGVVLTVVRNRNASAETLKWIYKNHRYPSYFYVALSSNPKTPTPILRQLYGYRHKNYGIGRRLAGNSNLPEDLLDKLIAQPDKYVLRAVLKRPALDCERMGRVIAAIEKLPASKTRRLAENAREKAKACIRD